jgi:hypothetical protein
MMKTMQASSTTNVELPLPDQDPVNSHRAWLCNLPTDPAVVPVPVTITLDATTWAAVAHRARQQR